MRGCGDERRWSGDDWPPPLPADRCGRESTRKAGGGSGGRAAAVAAAARAATLAGAVIGGGTPPHRCCLHVHELCREMVLLGEAADGGTAAAAAAAELRYGSGERGGSSVAAEAAGRSLTEVPSPLATMAPDCSPSRSRVMQKERTALPPASSTFEPICRRNLPDSSASRSWRRSLERRAVRNESTQWCSGSGAEMSSSTKPCTEASRIPAGGAASEKNWTPAPLSLKGFTSPMKSILITSDSSPQKPRSVS
mmetsp:Transcript_24856/g.81329  ORF Transcript_24856/g.81329 Transcript_24856/m.81329 type:complete len:252 (-) Transcript_24856:364-1119(-)